MFCVHRFGHRRGDIGKLLLAVAVMTLIWLVSCSVAHAQVQGFTEPFRTVEVASAESGVVTKMHLKVGDRVEAGQAAAELDASIQQAQYELARHMANTKAESQRFEAELQTKQSVHDHLLRLSEKGFAQEKELMRAQMELAVAQANALSSREHMEENKHRLQLAEVSLERRVIRTPLAGFVLEVHREPGEFLSPINPQVVTVVQVNPMIARFPINFAEVDRLRIDQTVTVKMDHERFISGTVYSIALNVNSDTVAVKVCMPNDENEFRSGQPCELILPPRPQLTQK